jgi:hypothetical protein
MSAPLSKYDGHSYKHDTLSKATLKATVARASVEDAGETLICHVHVDLDELDRLGIDQSVVYTEPIEGTPEYCVVNLNASRKWWLDEYSDLTVEQAEQAIEDGREEEVLPPWDGPLTATVKVERTTECQKKSLDSGLHVQYDPPDHEMGEIFDIRMND